MHFSLSCHPDQLPARSHTDRYRILEAIAVTADLLGFTALWLTDPCPSTGTRTQMLGYLTALSGVTRQIALGAVLTMPLSEPPARLADEIAQIAHLLEGRARLGFVLCPSDKVPVELPEHALASWLTQLQEALAFPSSREVGSVRHRSQGIGHHLLSPDLLWLVALESTVALAAQSGCGLIVPAEGDVPNNLALIHHYRDQQAGRAGRVALSAKIAVTTRRVNVQGNLRRQADVVRGTPQQIVAQLMIRQMEFHIDEIICPIHTLGKDQQALIQGIAQIGQSVLPLLTSIW